ncbi:MAG: hypothetical protein Q9171_003742 [Xanthocarpia ochracea]
MAEPFSAIAGAVSIVDVAIRSCNTLYDSVCYLKGAPGLTQDLQQTVQSTQSILQNLNALVARYRQLQVFTAQLHLPDAVNYEIVAIKTDLDVLSSLLPATHSTREVRTGLKWIKDRREVEKLVLKLQRHQLSLTLALQSPLQQITANSYENVLLLPEEIERHHLNTKNEIQADLGTMKIGLHDALRGFGQKAQESLVKQEHLKRLLESQHLSHNEDQVRLINEIHDVRSSLSDISSHVRTITTVRVPTESDVARVIRAEFLRVLKPTFEQCLDTFKASTDDQLRSMLKKLDEMAEHFGQELPETSHSCSSSNSYLSSDSATDQKCARDDMGATGLLEPAQMGHESPTVLERNNGFLVRRSKHWRRAKVIKWAIGTLRITVTSTHTTSTNVSYVGEIPQPQKAYRITIEFQPAQYLITLRGLKLSLAHIQDQRGHYEVSPLLATFAIVPTDADVMGFAWDNDVAGLQSLFERRLAAPSDRDETGSSPLMGAAFWGASDACRFLLDMGADPLATEDSGKGLLNLANQGFFYYSSKHLDLSKAYERYTSVLRPLQSLADDLVEHSYQMFNPLVVTAFFLQGRESEADVDPEHIETFFDYIQFLKKGGLIVDWTFEETPLLHGLCDRILRQTQQQITTKHMELALRVTLEIGGDISACNELGLPPLSYIFFRGGRRRPKYPQSITELATLLLQYGADPCDLDLNARSPFHIAHYFGLLTEFREALERSGFDIREVLRETRQRLKIFVDGHGESTAVDNEDLAAPSTEGISRRRLVVRETDEN